MEICNENVRNVRGTNGFTNGDRPTFFNSERSVEKNGDTKYQTCCSKGFQSLAEELGCDIDDVEFAHQMDKEDPLKHLRDEFIFPKMKDMPGVDLSFVESPAADCIYMSGNSLGLQPKGVKKYIETELEKWGKIGFHGYFAGDMPWTRSDELVIDDVAKLVGAEKGEVAVMNGLSVNLNLLMISFYKPTKKRYKVLIEDHAFPSDQFAVESQIRLHGFDPSVSLIHAKPRQGSHILYTEDILSLLEDEGDSIALVLFGGVQYYTGQFFDIESITNMAHAKGCMVGFDLAHAIGNVPLCLHKWQVDFAVWCSYKFLNSGAGSIAGAFMHNKHAKNDFPKLLGWWSHKKETRFEMGNELDLTQGIAGYRISNPFVMGICPLRASLDIFNQTSMDELREKSVALTGYLECLVKKSFTKPQDWSSSRSNGHPYIEIITPDDPDQRGSQLSLLFSSNIDDIHKELIKRGVCCDERKPNVIRVAPIPMYNSFEDVWLFHRALKDSINATFCDSV